MIKETEAQKAKLRKSIDEYYEEFVRRWAEIFIDNIEKVKLQKHCNSCRKKKSFRQEL